MADRREEVRQAVLLLHPARYPDTNLDWWWNARLVGLHGATPAELLQGEESDWVTLLVFMSRYSDTSFS